MLVLKNNYIFLPFAKTKIKPAKYIKVRDKIKNLKIIKRSLMQEYWDLQSKIIYSKTNIADTLQDKYTNLITSINNIDKEIDELNILLIPDKYTYTTQNKFTELYTNMKAQDILTNIDINNIIKMHDDVFFNDKSNKVNINSEPNFLIESSKELPIDSENTKIPESDNPPPKHKLLNKEQIDIIKERILILLKDKFKAKNKEECSSNKRSAAYYMNKDKLIETIEKEKLFKEIMPKNYKSLSKDKICEHLFF